MMKCYDNSSSVENILINAGVNTNQVTYINQSTNSMWLNGQHTVYANDVEDQVLIDWIYNRCLDHLMTKVLN